MGYNDPKSLQYAKYEAFKSICRRCELFFGTMLVFKKNSPRIFNRVGPFTLQLTQYDGQLKTRIHRCSLKYKGHDGHPHFFTVDFPTSFLLDPSASTHNNNKGYYFDFISRAYSSEVFDKMCQMSDDGIELYVVKTNPKSKTSDHVTVLAPYEGSKFQIEADLASPDYANLDASITPSF